MKRVYSVSLAVLSVLTLLSLVLNGIVIYALLEARRGAHRLVGEVRMLVDEATGDTFRYSVDFEQEVPISAEFPFSETFAVPVNTVIPIETTVVVPVDLGITTYRLRIPIDTVFPVDMELAVQVSQMVEIDTVVPLKVDVPVEVAVGETSLADYLEEIDRMLERAEEQLEGPIWQR